MASLPLKVEKVTSAFYRKLSSLERSKNWGKIVMSLALYREQRINR